MCFNVCVCVRARILFRWHNRRPNAGGVTALPPLTIRAVSKPVDDDWTLPGPKAPKAPKAALDDDWTLPVYVPKAKQEVKEASLPVALITDDDSETRSVAEAPRLGDRTGLQASGGDISLPATSRSLTSEEFRQELRKDLRQVGHQVHDHNVDQGYGYDQDHLRQDHLRQDHHRQDHLRQDHHRQDHLRQEYPHREPSNVAVSALDESMEDALIGVPLPAAPLPGSRFPVVDKRQTEAIATALQAKFKALDKNGNGFLEYAEFTGDKDTEALWYW